MRELTISRYTSTRRKPGATAKARAKRKRADDKHAKIVRAQCVERDGDCIVYRRDNWLSISVSFSDCAGPSQWTHMHSRRRSQTRNQAPDIRHDVQHSFMACQHHHNQYDGRKKPRLYVTALTPEGANGPLKIRLGR